jgi:U3 small nucleolar ribonucleoprotein component
MKSMTICAQMPSKAMAGMHTRFGGDPMRLEPHELYAPPEEEREGPIAVILGIVGMFGGIGLGMFIFGIFGS